jgi:hypothetical protein
MCSNKQSKKCTPARVKNCLRTFLVHLFSHVGLCVLVVGYAVIGGLIFQELEYTKDKENLVSLKKNEMEWQVKFNRSRKEYVSNLWNITRE